MKFVFNSFSIEISSGFILVIKIFVLHKLLGKLFTNKYYYMISDMKVLSEIINDMI
jgi:hypothetical protein